VSQLLNNGFPGDNDARPRVLVVEDEIVLGLDLEDYVLSTGCAVIGPKVKADDAIAAIETESIDIAIVGFSDGIDGTDALATALNARGIPFAFGVAADTMRVADLYPHTPVLHKPYLAEDVVRVVNSLMAARLVNSRD
jgi:hypothetical protein